MTIDTPTDKNSDVKKLYVRFSTQADEKAIFDFYAGHQHQFVFQRDPEVWKERIKSGAVTIIHDDKGEIIASSISYPVLTKDAQGNDVHKWTEIGSTRVAVEGIGLFKTLISAQIMRAYLLEPPDDRFALEIVLNNTHSKHVFLKHGATPFDIPPDMAKAVGATITSNGGQKVEWFQMGMETIPAFAQNLLDAAKSNRVVQKDTGQAYDVDFSKCVLMTAFADDIKAIAKLDCGDPAAPDLKRGIKSGPRHFGR